MNDWQVIRKNGWLPAVANCYLPAFPMEARSLLADWLWLDENKRVLSMEEENPSIQQNQCIYGFLHQMLMKLKQGIDELPMHDIASYCYKTSLNNIYSQMQVLVVNDHPQLFKAIQESLKNEKLQLNVLQHQNVDPKRDSLTMHEVPRKQCEILNEAVTNNIGQAQQICAAVDHAILWSNSRYSDFQNLQFRLQQQVQAGTNGVNVNYETRINAAKTQIQTEIHHTVDKCWNKFPELSKILDELESQIFPELEAYKDEQRFVALGTIPKHNLQFIQTWYEATYKCLCDLEKCLPDFGNLCQHVNPQYNPTVETLLGKVTVLRNKMMVSSLVIETQPHQILRKLTKFGPLRLRVLLSTSSIIIDEKAIVAMLINEGQAAELYSNPEHFPTNSGELKFGKGFPRVIKNVVEFKDLRVSEVKRKVKRGERAVVEEKFCIYLKISITMQGHSFTAWTTTLPLTVTSHPNQEGEAWGTILWDNGFTERGRKPFQVPEEVPWSSLIELIDLRFMSLTEDRRGLTANNKRYLKAKIFRNDIPANEMVSWKLFCKDPYMEVTKEVVYDDSCSEDQPKKKTTITFWEWVFSTLKLLSWCSEDPKLADQSLKRLWSQNKIVGFISETEMLQMLREPNEIRPGTFILRFPEQRQETIGIYYYNHRALNPKDALVKLKPYTTKELKQTPLQDRIIKNPLIAYLYPEEDKTKAFTRTTCRDHKTIDGYVDVGVQEYFSSSILERYKPGPPLLNMNTPSPSSHSYLSYHSQVLSPSVRSDNDNASTSNLPWPPASTSNENTLNASMLDDFYDLQQPECMDMNETVRYWLQDLNQVY